MAKRKNRAERDLTTRSLTSLLRPVVLPVSPLVNVPSMRFVEDGRLFNPTKFNYRTTGEKVGRLTVPVTRSKALPSTLAFPSPKNVGVCVRRKTRREVLFAQKKTGHGSRSKRRRRSESSSVRC